jgi:hypothetical protein
MAIGRGTYGLMLNTKYRLASVTTASVGTADEISAFVPFARRRVCRNVKRWRSAFMALRRGPQALCRKRSKASDDWRLTSNFERYVLLWKHARQTTRPAVSLLAKPTPLNINFSSDRFAMFNKQRDISPKWKEYSLYCS